VVHVINSVLIPPSTQSGSCRDQQAPSCLQQKAGWLGFDCDYARDWCSHSHWGADARSCCPATCGVCGGSSSPSIVDNAVATPALSTLVSVLTRPGYSAILNLLSGSGPFTVFAPTNDAFAAAGVNVNDVAAVSEVLKYHVLSGAVYSNQLSSFQKVPTLQGSNVVVRANNGGVTVNNADVVIADVQSSNGVVHVINSVLTPPSSMQYGRPCYHMGKHQHGAYFTGATHTCLCDDSRWIDCQRINSH